MKAQIIKFILFFRNGISLKTVSGESKAVTTKMIAPWNETTMLRLLSNYELDSIFNVDEFAKGEKLSML